MTSTTLDIPVRRHLHRLRATYRRRGWTIWHGNSTSQYWAAHTGRMVLLSGNSAKALATEIERVQPSGHPARVPTPRHSSPWRRLIRPRAALAFR